MGNVLIWENGKEDNGVGTEVEKIQFTKQLFKWAFSIAAFYFSGTHSNAVKCSYLRVL